MTITSKSSRTSFSIARRISAAVAASTLALTLAACGSGESPSSGSEAPAAGDQLKEITVGAPTSLSGLGLRAGIVGGHFSEEGLTVTPTTSKSANDAVPNLMSGAQHIAVVDTVTFLQARAQGLPVKVVAGNGTQPSDGEAGFVSAANIIAAADSDMSGAKDLEGKTVAVPGLKTQSWMNIRAAVDEAGGDSTKINFIEATGPQMIDLVQQGNADAATASEPLGTSSVAQGQTKMVMSYDAPGNKGVPTSVYISTEEFIAENPATIESFRTGLFAGATEILDDRELAVQIAQDELGYEADVLTDAFIMPFAAEPVAVEQLQRIMDLAVKYEVLEAPLDASELVANLD